MTRATLVWHYSGDERASDRRLTVAIGASLVIHALVVASLRGFIAQLPAQDLGPLNNVATLQAVLAGPRTELAPREPAPIELPIPLPLLVPPLQTPIETAAPRAQLPARAPPPGRVPQSGSDRPAVVISVKMVDDPSWLGAEYSLTLAQRFSRRAQKPPALLGSPALMYPPAALAAGTSGKVAALLTLDAQGHILDSTLVPEDGPFASAVANALKTAQFAPAEIDGKPSLYWAIVEYYFSIAPSSSAAEEHRVAAPQPAPLAR